MPDYELKFSLVGEYKYVFYTSLTGLNAATTELSVTSNNIANAGTSGFKRSEADFGDIFATSPLQKASAVVGRGVSLKEVS